MLYDQDLAISILLIVPIITEYKQRESFNPDIIYPTNPSSDTLLSVTDLAPL